MRQRNPLYRLLLLLDRHPLLYFAPLTQPKQVVALSYVLLLQLFSELLAHVSGWLPPRALVL